MYLLRIKERPGQARKSAAVDRAPGIILSGPAVYDAMGGASASRDLPGAPLCQDSCRL